MISCYLPNACFFNLFVSLKEQKFGGTGACRRHSQERSHFIPIYFNPSLKITIMISFGTKAKMAVDSWGVRFNLTETEIDYITIFRSTYVKLG
jgi:hypothetical protein